MKNRLILCLQLTLLPIYLSCMLCGCGQKEDAHLMDAQIVTEDPAQIAATTEPATNPCADLSVPTWITKEDGIYFIVDCYHNQVIYNDNLEAPLYEWKVMTSDLSMAHTLATDGVVYLIDDTENHRVVVFEKYDDKFVNTQVLNQIGERPHYIIYNESNRTFYAWSSMTGEMYLIKRDADTNQVYVSDIMKIDSLNGVYVRSFTIVKDKIYFVSGNSSIIQARLKDFKIQKEYPVPASMAGMIQLFPVDQEFLITISTDISGDQKFATMIQVSDLNDLSTGKYTDVYANFVGGGTPYYINTIDGLYYLTEHRIPGHSIWSFDFKNGAICDVQAIY